MSTVTWNVKVFDWRDENPELMIHLSDYAPTWYVRLYCNGIKDRASDLMTKEQAERLAAGWRAFYCEGRVPA